MLDAYLNLKSCFNASLYIHAVKFIHQHSHLPQKRILGLVTYSGFKRATQSITIFVHSFTCTTHSAESLCSAPLCFARLLCFTRFCFASLTLLTCSILRLTHLLAYLMGHSVAHYAHLLRSFFISTIVFLRSFRFDEISLQNTKLLKVLDGQPHPMPLCECM